MKLNHDTIREVMLYIEENSTLTSAFYANSINIEERTRDEIVYTCLKLHEAGYINASPITTSTKDLIITDITFSGHEFLDNIRDSEVWKAAKKLLGFLTSTSVTIVSQVASQVYSND